MRPVLDQIERSFGTWITSMRRRRWLGWIRFVVLAILLGTGVPGDRHLAVDHVILIISTPLGQVMVKVPSRSTILDVPVSLVTVISPWITSFS